VLTPEFSRKGRDITEGKIERKKGGEEKEEENPTRERPSFSSLIQLTFRHEKHPGKRHGTAGGARRAERSQTFESLRTRRCTSAREGVLDNTPKVAPQLKGHDQIDSG